jgi:hypothetical protein
MLSIARSITRSFARNVPLCRSNWSTSVVFPWSTWAMMATLRLRTAKEGCCGDVSIPLDYFVLLRVLRFFVIFVLPAKPARGTVAAWQWLLPFEIKDSGAGSA